MSIRLHRCGVGEALSNTRASPFLLLIIGWHFHLPAQFPPPEAGFLGWRRVKEALDFGRKTMGCIGVLMVLVGLIMTIAAAAFPPAGLLGIFLMWTGWKLFASDTPASESEPPKPRDPKIML